MYLHFKNKRITGILTVVPQNAVRFDDEVQNYSFSKAQCMQLKKVMGYNQHRIVRSEACISDLIREGFNHIFTQNWLQREDIDAFILLTNSPDYPVPPTSNMIQGMLGLKQDMICLDINQGCAGYMVGLSQAFMLLEQPEIRKVAVVTADVASRTHSNRDRASFPLMGDAASITIVENGPSDDIHMFMKMDGKGALSIWQPAGGLREPASEDTIRMREETPGNFMTRHHIRMQGDAVFNFVMQEVPAMLEELFHYYGLSYDEVDYFMMHQPNKFILNRVASKIGVPKDKMPANVVETLGNSISSTIPCDITFNLHQRPESESFRLCLAGFGEGLIWGATILDIGSLDFCRMIEIDI